MRILIRWLILSIALIVAVLVVPGIRIEGTEAWLAVIATAAILGLFNTFIRPILAFLSCGLIALTLGLFLLIINAFTLWLSSWIAQNIFEVGFIVDGFFAALLGSLIVSFVAWVLSFFLD